MKKLAIKLAGILAAATLTFAAVGSAPVSALDVFSGCSGNSNSAICKESKKGPSVGTVVARVVRIMMWVLGSLSVIMIVFAGIRFVTSAGKPDEVKAARNGIIYAVVGLVVALLGFAIVNFVSKNIL